MLVPGAKNTTKVGSGGGGSFGAPGGGADPNALKSAIASQLLSTANDTGTTTSTSGHAGYTISHAADRAAASKRTAGYQKDTKKAVQNAVKAISARNKGINSSYANAANADNSRAKTANSALASSVKSQTLGVDAAAANLGLTSVQDAGDTDAAKLSAIFSGMNTANAGSDARAATALGRTQVARNNSTADSFRYGALQQKTALNAMLEQTLSGLQDQTVASTLHTSTRANVSEAQKLSALGQLRYLDKDTAAQTLAQQRLAAQLGGTTTTTSRGAVGKDGSSTTVVRKR